MHPGVTCNAGQGQGMAAARCVKRCRQVGEGAEAMAKAMRQHRRRPRPRLTEGPDVCRPALVAPLCQHLRCNVVWGAACRAQQLVHAGGAGQCTQPKIRQLHSAVCRFESLGDGDAVCDIFGGGDSSIDLRCSARKQHMATVSLTLSNGCAQPRQPACFTHPSTAAHFQA